MRYFKDILNKKLYFENELPKDYNPETYKEIENEPTVVEYKLWCDTKNLDAKNYRHLEIFMKLYKEKW